MHCNAFVCVCKCVIAGVMLCVLARKTAICLNVDVLCLAAEMSICSFLDSFSWSAAGGHNALHSPQMLHSLGGGAGAMLRRQVGNSDRRFMGIRGMIVE